MQFNELNIHEDVLAGIDAMNYLQASPIQEMAIPFIPKNSIDNLAK